MGGSSYISGFSIQTREINGNTFQHPKLNVFPISVSQEQKYISQGTTRLYPVQLHAKNDNAEDSSTTSLLTNESDQLLLGAFGTASALITLYSEFTLKTTGCGLPAGPFGLIGGAEGISYLAIVGIAAFAIFSKIKTGSGLPAGPGGILGLAEGLSFLSILSGLFVLGFQVIDYGYIPNAVPMEGGMCQ